MRPTQLLLLLLLGALSLAQEPSLEERLALHQRYRQARSLVRGGRVDPVWLDDGSSFTYRARARRMFLDPEVGEPRRATMQDRQRAARDPSRMRAGRTWSPDLERYARQQDGDVFVGREGEAELRLTEDAGQHVYWVLELEGWSPDGRRLVLSRVETSAVHQLPVVEYRTAVETLDTVPYVKAGTPLPRQELVVFDTRTGARTDLTLGASGEHYVFPIGWREGGAEFLFLRLDRRADRLVLMASDPESGTSRAVVTETSETFVGGLDFIVGGWRRTFTALEGTDHFLWLSERDGWRHVYRYDYSGALVNRVTGGQFPVLEVAGVDVPRGRAFVLANAEARVYDTHLYQADLAGGELTRLTEAAGEHEIELSPSKRWFVDHHSSLERPPAAELRSVEGELVARLAEADVSKLTELGWSPPEPFVVEAADGQTDLHGVLYRPAWFDPDARYPVLDYIYSGPFLTIVPHDFQLTSIMSDRAQAMAQLGFVTFLLDPRGTTERGKAFQDATFGRIGELEIADHAAALRQLAQTRPYMDLERVGVFGHSWGGYFALRAMLQAPEVFHVGISGAPGELTEAASINEPYMGLPSENPDGYARGANASLAANLRGELLILHGTADVNAPFSTSMRMVEALIEADKRFDLLVLPGATHYFQGAHARYVDKRIRGFFLEHLRGEREDG